MMLLPASGSAQEPSIPVTGRAIYFDISSPLRERLRENSGKADLSWKEGILPNDIRRSGSEEQDRPGFQDTVVQREFGRNSMDSALLNFDGLANVNNIVPPDTYGDVGPSHYVQLVNLSFAIYDKTGVKLLGPVSTGSIWEGMPHNSNNGDGVVLYDEQAGRWLISQFSLPTFPYGPFYQMIAVSQTPDPTGSWYRWEFESAELPDYPKFGVWRDGFYMSFTRLKSGTLQKSGIGVVAFDRTAMISGDPGARYIQFLFSNPYTILPADCDGPFAEPGSPNYYGFVRPGFFVIREFQANWTDPSASTFGNTLELPIAQFAGCGQGIPQKESDKLLTPLDDRLMYRLQYRNFGDHQAMVVNHTVGVGPGAGIRWYELRKTNGNWFVNQQSTYAPDTLSRWMGSIAMDTAGNMALGYSVSGNSIYPSIRYTGRMNHDPPGVMTLPEHTIIAGAGSQTGIWSGQSRWGDYSSMTVDPSAPSTFWYTQEYYATTSNNGWSTRIASFSFSGILDIQATATPPTVCKGDSAQLDVEVSGGSGPCTYQWTSDPPGFASGLRNPRVLPVTPTTYIIRVTSGTQVKTDSVRVPLIPLPVAFAGIDTTICRYVPELRMAGSVINSAVSRWYTSGDGYFDQPEALNTLYHLGLYDKQSDSLTFRLTAYSVADCQPVSAFRHVGIDACSGMSGPGEDRLQLNLSPNPATSRLTIRVTGARLHRITFVISDVLGKELHRETPVDGDSEIIRTVDVSAYPRGICFVKVTIHSGILVRPFVKH